MKLLIDVGHPAHIHFFNPIIKQLNENGNETTLDYPRILQLVKDSGYTNFIGVEYEGTRLSEREGILATKNLLLNSVASLK